MYIHRCFLTCCDSCYTTLGFSTHTLHAQVGSNMFKPIFSNIEITAFSGIPPSQYSPLSPRRQCHNHRSSHCSACTSYQDTGWWLSPTPLKNMTVNWEKTSQYMEIHKTPYINHVFPYINHIFMINQYENMF